MVRLADKTRGERIRDANKARKLLEEFTEYIGRMEERYKNDWAKEQDAEKRELIWFKHAALKDVVTDMTGLIGDGRMATEEEKHER